jgi:sigma-E factor negative regulatory protein RseC|tara:strand:+ start:5724 stop:6173 length:450 start_codon:yes stop_codon:yes gene_type:complete
MIHETGTVVYIQGNELWVETIQQSTCQTCAAEKGCGQRLIAKVTGRTTAIRVLPGLFDLKKIRMHDKVVIGIPEKVIVTGTLLTYFLPLTVMVLAVLFIGQFSVNDVITALGAMAALCAGGLIVRIHSHFNRNNHEIHPILLEQTSVTG